jgi:dTMP kinase
MYLAGDFGDDPGSVNAYAASSFFAVDRYASYIREWRGYYEDGGLILTDRYTTSNALHQGAKMNEKQRSSFFMWLYEYEFNLIGLPIPDLVIYLDIDVDVAAERLLHRQKETGVNADIHEQDIDYLINCAKSGKQAAAQFGWHKISCVSEGVELGKDDLHEKIYKKIFG